MSASKTSTNTTSLEEGDHSDATHGEAESKQALSDKEVRALTQEVTSRSTHSFKDPGPPPDGGLQAWTQALMCHLVMLNSWGYINSFGVWQTYYVRTLGRSDSDISWIGSFQVFLLFFIGTYSGRALDAGLFRWTFGAGAIIQFLGVLTTSWATKYWQIFLSQGICTGLGNGLMFCPAVAICSTYFDKKKTLALGFASSGTVPGGIIFPIMVQQLLDRVGFGWTVRAVALVMGVINLVTFVFLKPRIPPRKAGPIVEWAAFKEPTFNLFCIGMFLGFWSVYFGFFYIASFARDIIHFSYNSSLNLVITVNAVGLPGRLIPAYLADRAFGPINLLVPCMVFSAIVLYSWIAIDSKGGLYAFAAVYGWTSGGVTALVPPSLSSLTTDLSKMGVRMGMGFTIFSFAVLTGPPLGGALIRNHGGGYLYAQIWAGTAMLLAAAFMTAARLSKTGRTLKVKI